MFDQLGITVLADPAGRPAISTLAARKLFQHLRRRDELAVEDHYRLFEKMAAKRRVSSFGVPVVEGATPYESLVAAGGVVSPKDEFHGNPKPNFLAEELAEVSVRRMRRSERRRLGPRSGSPIRLRTSCGETADSVHGDAD